MPGNVGDEGDEDDRDGPGRRALAPACRANRVGVDVQVLLPGRERKAGEVAGWLPRVAVASARSCGRGVVDAAVVPGVESSAVMCPAVVPAVKPGAQAAASAVETPAAAAVLVHRVCFLVAVRPVSLTTLRRPGRTGEEADADGQMPTNGPDREGQAARKS